MKKLILVILLIPTLCFAQVTVTTPKPTTPPSNYLVCTSDPGHVSSEMKKYGSKASMENVKNSLVFEKYATDLSFLVCWKSTTNPIIGNLRDLHEQGFRLVNVIDDKSGVLYYMERIKSAQ